MAQQVSLGIPEFITKDYLIKNFDRMNGRSGGTLSESSYYTHFVPKLASWKVDKIASLDQFPIYECNCGLVMERFAREACVEDPLMEKVNQIFDKKKPLVIYSLGSGGCYQELSTCVKLAKQGYTVKQIVLADTKYTTNQPDLTVKTFSVFVKLLFPDSQVQIYQNEAEYLESIKNLEQPKPDIILCIDVEEGGECLISRKKEYSKMLGSDECVFAYHNHSSSGITTTFIDKIQGSSEGSNT